MSTMQSKGRRQSGAEQPDPRPPEAVADRLAGLLPEEAPYREIGSSGALTLIAVAWQLTLFERAVEEGAPHPGFVIIDSPQKNLSPDAVGDVEFLDPKIVDRMWDHIAIWAKRHPQAQLIFVDNTPPEDVLDHVIVRFSRDPESPPYGLISDESG